MKKFFYGIVCLAMTAGFYSCNGSDPEFQIMNGDVYAIQTGTNQFSSIAWFGVAYGELKSGRITQDGVPVSGTSYVNNVYESTASSSILSIFEGNYTFTATSTEGETASISWKLSFEEPMGDLNVEDFEYSSGVLKMTVTEPVEKARAYGFFIRPIVDGELFRSSYTNNWFAPAENPVKEGEHKVQMSFSFSQLSFNSDVIMIYPAAFNGSSTTNMLIRYNENEGRILKKGASSFEE